jgi:very-short-patch-repair endonuclease
MAHTPKTGRVAGSDLVVELDMDPARARATVAETFLSEWLRFPSDQRPEKWEAGQTGSKRIEDTSLDEIVSKWHETPLKFNRAARHSILIRPRERDARHIQAFPRAVSAWFAKSCGADAARDFWMLAVKHFEPAFAMLTTREEYHRKHCRHGGAADCPAIGTSECLHGNRVCETIPGIYWITCFGPRLVERIGELRLRSISIGQAQPFGEGYILTAYESPKLIGSDDARARERVIVGHLGERHFFRGNERSTRRARYGSRTQRYAEENRRKPTKAESGLAKFLNELDGGRLRGQFTTEWPFGGRWILDVYFPQLRLGFEVDGGYHNLPERKEKDRLKARDCADLGIKLVRFTNDEITGTDGDALAAKIRWAIDATTVAKR